MEKLYEQYFNDREKQTLQKLGDTSKERSDNSREARENLLKPFEKVDFESQSSFSGLYSIEQDGEVFETRIDFSYVPISSEIKEDIEKIQVVGDKKIFKITNIEIESKNYIFDNKKIKWPEEGVYFVDTQGVSDVDMLLNFDSISHSGLERIVVASPPNTPRGILSLLHELSHYWNRFPDNEERFLELTKTYSRINRDEHRNRKLMTDMLGINGEIDSEVQKMIDTIVKDITTPTYKDVYTILNEERLAWAGILREAVELLKPFSTRQDITRYVYFSLFTYIKTMKMKLEK